MSDMRRKPAAGLYSVNAYQIDESLGYLIAKVRWMLSAALDRELAVLDISHAQFGMLVFIAHGRGRTAAELARGIECDTGSMKRMLDRLEKKGLIQRKRSREDRRQINLSLTASGKRVTDKLPAIGVKVLNEHLQGFSREELETFKGFLRRMLANRKIACVPAFVEGDE